MIAPNVAAEETSRTAFQILFNLHSIFDALMGVSSCCNPPQQDHHFSSVLMEYLRVRFMRMGADMIQVGVMSVLLFTLGFSSGFGTRAYLSHRRRLRRSG
jgi:hypothetical protein